MQGISKKSGKALETFLHFSFSKKGISLYLAIIAVLALNATQAQFIKRMADRAKNKLEQKAGDNVDKGVDEATDIKKKDKKKADPDDDDDDNTKE